MYSVIAYVPMLSRLTSHPHILFIHIYISHRGSFISHTCYKHSMYNSKRLALSSLFMCTYHAFVLHMIHIERAWAHSTAYTHTHTELLIHFMHTSCRCREVCRNSKSMLNSLLHSVHHTRKNPTNVQTHSRFGGASLRLSPSRSSVYAHFPGEEAEAGERRS